MGFDATSLYPSATSDKNSVFPKIESGFAFKPDMKDVYVEALNSQRLNENGNESAILRIKEYNPPNIIFEHLQIKK